MFADWNHIVTLVLAFCCCQSTGSWSADALTPADLHGTKGHEPEVRQVAIIGAGAAGASTAYYLRNFSSDLAVNITVFERNGYIGGRSTTVNAYNNPLEPVELGASIFVEVNSILKNASQAFGLRPRDAGSDMDEILGIWNGKTFVYTQKDSGWKYWDIAKLLWKYGLAPIRTQRMMKAVVGRFAKLYQYPFFPFRSLTSRAYDLELIEVTSQTGQQLLAANKIGEKFATDIIQASTRVNYGQNLNLIHGLETMVCMAIEGAMSIAGGNWQIFEGMIQQANANVLLNTTVNSISKSKGKYSIQSSSLDAETAEFITNEDLYDTVVLAAPFQFSDITFDTDVLAHTPEKIPYVQLHVTLFTSPLPLNPLYFNITPGTDIPTTILTTLPLEEVPSAQEPEASAGSPGFFSISTLRQVINPETLQIEYLYKVFSPQALTADFLSGILGTTIPTDFLTTAQPGLTWYYPKVWYSYPYEYPRVTFEDSELARGFYYTAGMESFISTMETNALMGMNVARLIANDYLEMEGKEVRLGKGPEQVVLREKEAATEL